MTQSISLCNTTVSFQVLGEGTPVLLLHGYGLSSFIWKDVTPELLKRGFKVILPDLPGFGLSGDLPEPSMEFYARCFAQFLDHIQVDGCTIFGHSMSGYFGSLLANQSSSVNGFAYINSHPFVDSVGKKKNRKRSIDFINKHGLSLYAK